MVLVRFRSSSEAKDTIKKLKKMHKFTKELIKCFEEKIEDDDDEDDDDEYYRYEDDEMENRRGNSYYRRGRRSM